MSEKVLLDASVLKGSADAVITRAIIQQNCIQFEMPDGFAEIPLIEECRALNALDLSNPDNFDLMYDITMQLLSGKVVVINYIDIKSKKKTEVTRFLVTGRYMDLHGVILISEYPIIVNWLVEFVAGWLGKKFPTSLQDMTKKQGAVRGK